MLIGYARVSTTDQETHLQIDALHRAGVTRIYEEKASSVGRRHQLQVCLAALCPGDVLVVYKIDRFARSLKDLLSILDRIADAGASMKSLCEPLDTTSYMGVFMIQMLGAVAQLERSMIRERSMAGQAAAVARGARIGRPSTFQEGDALMVGELWETGHYTLRGLAHVFDVHESAIKRVVYRGTRHGLKLKEKRAPLRSL